MLKPIPLNKPPDASCIIPLLPDPTGMSAHALDDIRTGVVARILNFATKTLACRIKFPAMAEKASFKKRGRGLVRAPARRVGG